MNLIENLNNLMNHKIGYSTTKTNDMIAKYIDEAVNGNKLGDIIQASTTLLKLYPHGFECIDNLVRDTSKFLPIFFYSRVLSKLEEMKEYDLNKPNISSKVREKYEDLINYLNIRHTNVFHDATLLVLDILNHNISHHEYVLDDIHKDIIDDIVSTDSCDDEIIKIYSKHKFCILTDILFYVLSSKSDMSNLINQIVEETSKFPPLYLSTYNKSYALQTYFHILSKYIPSSIEDKLYGYFLKTNSFADQDTIQDAIGEVNELKDILIRQTYYSQISEKCHDENVAKIIHEASLECIDMYTEGYMKLKVLRLESNDYDEEDDELPHPDDVKKSITGKFVDKIKNFTKTTFTKDNMQSSLTSLKNNISGAIKHVKKNGVSAPMGKSIGNAIGAALDFIIGKNLNENKKYGTNYLVKAVKKSTNKFKDNARNALVQRLLKSELEDLDESDVKDNETKRVLANIKQIIKSKADKIEGGE